MKIRLCYQKLKERYQGERETSGTREGSLEIGTNWKSKGAFGSIPLSEPSVHWFRLKPSKDKYFNRSSMQGGGDTSTL